MYRIGMLSVLLVSLSLGGCGKLNESERKDVSRVMAGLVSGAGTGSGLNSRISGEISRLKNEGQGLMWLARFQTEADLMEGKPLAAAYNASDCTAGYSDPQFSCTSTCNDAKTSLTMSCNLTGEEQFICKGTTYTVKSGTFSVSVDQSAVTLNTSTTPPTYSGSFVVGMTMAADVSGGELKGGKLECTMGMAFDTAKYSDADTSNNDDMTVSCDNFSCKYDGDSISCEDLKTTMDAEGGCS